MILQRLLLQGFRNLLSCDLSPGQGLNILHGDNGQGKTNFLEAIYFLSTLSPIRPSPLRQLIFFGSEHARIQGEVSAQEIEKELSVLLRVQSKTVKVNGKGVSRGVDYFGELAVLLFSPDTLKLVQGGPEYRRRFVDTAISRTDRRYLLDLREYKKILEQRNRVLQVARQGRVSRKILDTWTEQLVAAGSRILEKRFRYLAELGPVCTEVFGGLLEKKEPFRIEYRSSFLKRSGQEETALADHQIQERFRTGLQLVERKEVHTGLTQMGPHLDDLVFLLSGRPARAFASQGEKRVIALALTLAEARLYKKKRGAFPILLLDDVNSELDGRHQQILTGQIQGFGQVFLTTTDGEVYEKIAPRSTLFRVRKGEIFLEKKD